METIILFLAALFGLTDLSFMNLAVGVGIGLLSCGGACLMDISDERERKFRRQLMLSTSAREAALREQDKNS